MKTAATITVLIVLAGCATQSPPEHAPVTEDNFHLVVGDVAAFTLEHYPYDPGKGTSKAPTADELATLVADFKNVLAGFGLEEDGDGPSLSLGVTFSVAQYQAAGVELRARLALLSPSKKQKLYKGIRNGFHSESVVHYRGDLSVAIDKLLAERRAALIDDLPRHFCEFVATILPARPNNCEEPRFRETSVKWDYPPEGANQGRIPLHLLPPASRTATDQE